MTAHFKLDIPGISQASGTAEVFSPYDRSLIATVETGDAAVVEQALATAYAAFRNKAGWLKVYQRVEILEKAAAIMEQRAEELATEAAREGGKPLIDSRVEVARAIDGVKLCAEVIRTSHGTEIPMNLNPASAGRAAFTQFEPIGVVAAVSAFNHPLNLIVHQVGPAVAAGCPFVVKPATSTPTSCFRFVQILHEAGLPKELGQVVVTADREAATNLVCDPRVAFFSFIGSPGVGWSLRSKLAPGTRCALEHGGAAPVIVAGDADLDDMLPLLAKGGFYHAGQVCVSVQRVFADRAIAGDVAAGLAEFAGKMIVGDPVSADTEVGPLIEIGENERVAEWVSEAVGAHGAEVKCGGEKLSETCYQPTVLFDPGAEARVSKQEIFGPVVCVYPYDDMDEAIARANSIPFKFQAAVATRSLDTALRCYKQLDASAVMVNDHTAFRVDWMPFAGLNQSGHGVGGIHHTLHDMQIEKMMVIRSPQL